MTVAHALTDDTGLISHEAFLDTKITYHKIDK